jgi:hypothetical protein
MKLRLAQDSTNLEELYQAVRTIRETKTWEHSSAAVFYKLKAVTPNSWLLSMRNYGTIERQKQTSLMELMVLSWSLKQRDKIGSFEITGSRFDFREKTNPSLLLKQSQFQRFYESIEKENKPWATWHLQN